MPPKKQGSGSNGPKQRTARCREDERSPGSCARGAQCRFAHEQPDPQKPQGSAASSSQSFPPQPFGFGELNLTRYREAAVRIAKSRSAGNITLQSIRSQLKDLWDAHVGDLFPPTMPSALALFQSRIDLSKHQTKPTEWPQCFNAEPLDPSVFDQLLSQLILQRDFALGLLGASTTQSPEALNFLAVDATFLRQVKSSLASPTICPYQPTSCLPHVIRSLIKFEPKFLEIMLDILPSSRDAQCAELPQRVAQGARLCHILQQSFGFDIQDLKPLYGRFLTIPLSSFSGPRHSGEWRAVTESPPQRYNLRGESLGRITKYCVDEEADEGCSCLHRRLGPERGVIQRDHWSCCGATEKLDLSCIHANSASKLRCDGLRCSFAHPLSIHVCLPHDSPVNATCMRCGLDGFALSCVSTFCSVCNKWLCSSCSESINTDAAPDPKKLEQQKSDAGGGAAGGGAAGGGAAGGGAMKGTSAQAGFNIDDSNLNPAVASFVQDIHSGAGWTLTKVLCDVIDNKRLHPHEIHIIQLLLTSLNMDSCALDEALVFDKGCCRSLSGAIAAVLARPHSSLYPDRDIPLDLRVRREQPSDIVSPEIPYLDHVIKLIKQTKRFNEFADKLVPKILQDHPTPADLISLTEDRSRLLVALEVAYFELKHPSSKSKSGMLKQLLEMGCFPRKFAVKAVLKSSRAEEAVNFFFSQSRTASDEDESEDAVLSNTGEVSAALKTFVSVAPPSEPSSGIESGSELRKIADISARVDYAQLLVAISTARSSLEMFSDLKELTYPVMKELCDQVEANSHNQKVTSDAAHTSESDLRLLLQSFMQNCSHSRSLESLRCFSGHPLVLQPCLEQTRCAHCSLPLSAGNQHFSCQSSKPGSKSSNQCDFAMCLPCGQEHISAYAALYSPFDISTSIHALECLIPSGTMPENLKAAFASVAGSAELAVAPVVSFGWKSPEIPIPETPSIDICGPDCKDDHSDASAICARCDRRYSSHKPGHLCNDGERGYFISSQSTEAGQSPIIQGPFSSPQIDMQFSSIRPISLVHSETGKFTGGKWTCTLVNTGERGRNTWIGLCDANVVAQHATTSDFKGLGTRSKGFSIGFNHELGVRVDDKTTPRPSTGRSFFDGQSITIVYDEPGRKLDVIVSKKVVYTHAGLPHNLMFAISSGDKKSKFSAVKCRQVDAPSSLDAHCSSLLEICTRAISNSESWSSETFFALLSLLSIFRTKPHHVLSSKFLPSTQATMVRILTQLIESDDLNDITSRVGVCDRIFTELGHIVEFNRKSLLKACVVQLKRVSIALLQGRGTLSTQSLEFLSKLYAFCSMGFAQTTALAFDHLIKCLADVQSSESLVNYIRIPRWAIEAIDPSRSFLSLYSMFGAIFPAMLHAGWVDIKLKDGKTVRLSCEAAQVLMQRIEAKDLLVSSSDNSIASVLKIGPVASSIDHELATNGLLYDLHSDCDIIQTPLHTASLPSSIHIGSCCIDAVAWFKVRLVAQARVDEIEAVTACCLDTGSSPAIVQSVLTDLVRRSFVSRKHGVISLLDPSFHDSLSVSQQPIVFGLPPCNDSFTVSQAVFFTIEDSVAPSHWASSISSSSSISMADFETDLSDTLYGLQRLDNCNDIFQTARKFEECNGSVTAFVFQRDSGSAPSPALSIIRSKGSCPICLEDEFDLVRSPCGHLSCTDCYSGLLQTAISDSGSPLLAKGYENLLSITAIKCTTNGCKEHLPLSFLQEVVPDLADVTRRILFRTLLRILNNSSCPISSCLCGQSMLIGTSQDCEAICGHCGRCATIGDFKRKEISEVWLPHSTISSEENLNWKVLNDVGNSDRRDLMRFKACPHCGTATTRCGCDPKKIECDNLERCPNEKCDHIDCTVCKKRWCWVCGGPSCPTKCAKPALERTHRKEKFLLSQNAIDSMYKATKRIDEHHMFLRARSEFLKLFYRGPEVIDASDDAALALQLVSAAVTTHDFDTARFLLYEQMLRKSKRHATLLWLAFATLTESSILKVIRENNTPLAIMTAFYDMLACSQVNDSSGAVTKFDPSTSNGNLAFADGDQSVTRPGSVSSYPMARAPITRGPGFKPLEHRSFSVCMERAPNNSNSTSFGIAAKSVRIEGSDGVGPTADSWGVICTFGGSNVTKVMASGRQVATWRMLQEGDVLRAQYYPDGSLYISLNLFECEHRFQLPEAVVASFGMQNPEEDKYTFAMTLASDHRAKIF